MPPRHVLTVNVEDYFQVGAFQQFIRAETWYRFESRLKEHVDKVLSLLAEHDTRATFFVLGWIGEKHPELVQTIADAGHEIASRGYLHQSLQSRPREMVREDIHRAKCVLEDVTGAAVDGFRLSDGWLNKNELWLLEDLAETGYRYDSSILPNRREFGDDASWRQVRPVETPAGTILEIPLSTLSVPGGWLPVAGGNYHRQVPNFVMQKLVGRCVAHEPGPFVMYFQTWELDSTQPRLSVADRVTKLRHYRKLGKYCRILPQYLMSYEFCSIREHAALAGSPLSALNEDAWKVGAPIGRSAGFPSTSEADAFATGRRSDRTLSFSGTVSSRIISTAGPKPVQQLTSGCRSANENTTGSRTDLTPVTLVIPCFNEESSLTYLANTLTSVIETLADRYAPRILFVDDCSSDRTAEKLQELYQDESAVRVIRHTQNRGVSAAILTGIRNADTEIVCSMDCDCSYDPHELRNMLPLLTNDVAMVTASPYHSDGQVRNVPAWRLVLSRGLSAMYRQLLGRSLATWTSCFRVYRRHAILDLPLKEDGFLGTAELAAFLTLNNRAITEYPATLEVRLFGLSKMKTVKAILSHLRLLTGIAVTRFTGQQICLSQTPENNESTCRQSVVT
ncbi:MAG: glycosyltransferase [Planctomycetaceae bacterium]|nr:glycosyltransferase [Planctomycetaceae bacterium]